MNEIKSKNKWPLVGNTHIADFLDKNIEKNSVSHAYIMNGPKDLGKSTVAYYFAKNLICKKDVFSCDECASCNRFARAGRNIDDSVDPNLILIKKEEGKKNISIEQIREFVAKLGMTSFDDSYKIGIIKGADTLSLEAANSLLKTLEEPRKKVVIILIVNNLEALPKTIVSRSQVLNFRPVKTNIIHDYLVSNHKASRSAAKNISRLSMGRPALALKLLEDKDFYEEYLKKINLFLDFFQENTNTRIQKINELGKLSPKETESIIGIWQSIIRDFFLSKNNLRELVRHEVEINKINNLENKIKTDSLIKINNVFESSFKFLKSNVNPKLVLENIVINI